MKKLIIFFAAILTGLTAVANQPYTAVKGSKITVAGTSTMHDWTMTSEDVKVQANLNTSGQGGYKVEALKFSVPVNTLKSGKSGMDDNAYKALNEKKFPSITFEIANANASGTSAVEATGQLTIAGVTKTITTKGKMEKLSNGDVKITGSYKLNMKDYEVEPPSFMFGTVNTGEEVTVSYELILSN